MDRPEIQIEDLLVRPWRKSDAEAVYRACQDPDIQRWIPLPRPYEMSHALGFVTDFSNSTWDNQTAANFGVFDRSSGELLANMGLVRIDITAKNAELGYWTAPAARGRGVATRAGRAVTAWGFEALGIERLIWRADIGNHASRLVALRIGFQMEGVQRGGLMAVDGSGMHIDGWVASMRPGDVTPTTPERYAAGSPAAIRAQVFSRPTPTLALPGGGVLRPATDDDIDAITAACQDPETLRWTTIPPGYQRSDAENFARVYAPGAWQQGTAAIFAIADASGAYCGGIDLRISQEDSSAAEIGFQVAPWARGRGLASEALRTLAVWGFDALGLTRVKWRAHVGNDGSRRVAEKASFTFEGIQRQGCLHRGERRDAWVAAMLATDPR